MRSTLHLRRAGAAGGTFVHEIAAPDSLATFALAFCGDPPRADSILAADRDVRTDADALAAGRRLIVPEV